MNVKSADAGIPPKDGRTIQSVTRALDILEVLSMSEGEMPLNEIARMTGLNVSTCHHILLTLLTRGYVGQAQKGRSYSLGSKVIELSSNRARQFSLVDLAMPALRELNDRTGENVHLAVIQGNDLVILTELASPKIVRVVTDSISLANAAHASAIGKAILAWLPEPEITRILDHKGLTKFTDRTVVDRHDLIEGLRHVRRFGFAMEREEFLPGVVSVGTAIRDYSGTVLGAVGCTIPGGRADEDHLELVKEAVQACAGSIATRLGRPSEDQREN